MHSTSTAKRGLLLYLDLWQSKHLQKKKCMLIVVKYLTCYLPLAHRKIINRVESVQRPQQYVTTITSIDNNCLTQPLQDVTTITSITTASNNIKQLQHQVVSFKATCNKQRITKEANSITIKQYVITIETTVQQHFTTMATCNKCITTIAICYCS